MLKLLKWQFNSRDKLNEDVYSLFESEETTKVIFVIIYNTNCRKV